MMSGWNGRLLPALALVLVGFAGAGEEFPLDPLVGVYEGTYTADDGSGGPLGWKVVALGGDKYTVVFGVEADGQTKSVDSPATVKRDGDTVTLTGKVDVGEQLGGVYDWVVDFRDGVFTGKASCPIREVKIEFKKVKSVSPTMGKKPPEGAVVLFDGTSTDAFAQRDGKPAHWPVLDGVMRSGPAKSADGKVTRGDLVTKRRDFGDLELHVEFMTPFMPKARGQARGNSGVYVHGRYEVQVLDSFGLPPKDNEAGGIYQVSVPKTNAALPPGEWQTYDISFKAPRFDAGGKLIEQAEITVLHNGILIHDKVKIPHPTAGGLDNKMESTGGLLLQDHGDYVRFRNVWLLPKKAE
jgi:hypothetical protein